MISTFKVAKDDMNLILTVYIFEQLSCAIFRFLLYSLYAFFICSTWTDLLGTPIVYFSSLLVFSFLAHMDRDALGTRLL